MTAYEQELSSYNDQVAAAAVGSGVAIQGQNPDINRRVERDELRKGALRLLTDSFAAIQVGGQWRLNEQFDAMQDNQGVYHYPEFDVAESLTEGKIIQFFEQAFEWQNITYRFYPYFWGRKGKWKDTVLQNDVDPLFADFLRAGAARIVVPVRPAYADAVCYFLNTNIIWNGGDVPNIDDPLYISIADELKEDASGDIPQGLDYCSVDGTLPCLVDQWTVKLPTTLVYLQRDSSLPTFPIPGGHDQDSDLLPTELAGKLDEMAKQSGEKLDWRASVVDLMKLLGRDSSLAARQALAKKLGCPKELQTDNEGMNIWLHSKLLDLLKKNNGKLPPTV